MRGIKPIQLWKTPQGFNSATPIFHQIFIKPFQGFCAVIIGDPAFYAGLFVFNPCGIFFITK